MLDRVKAREKEFSFLWDRQDFDEELIKDYKYILKDYPEKGSKEIRDAYSVTRNIPSNDYNKFTNKLIALRRKIKVHSDDLEFDEGKIIQFCLDSDFAVDQFLAHKGKHGSRTFHNAFICHRGWVAEQTLWRYEDGKLVTDSRPLDPRWVVWDTDGEQISLGCTITFRYPSDVNSEYHLPNKKFPAFTGTKLLKIRDCWDLKKNKVYVEGNLVLEEDNSFVDFNEKPYVPIIILPAPYGPVISGDEQLEYTGESIFYPQRHTYDEANFAASISKTMAREGLFPAYQTKGKAPKQYPVSRDIAQDQTEPLELIPQRDMTNAQRNYQGMVDGDLQTSTYASVGPGFPNLPMSGDAIGLVNSGGAEALSSRIQGLKAFDAMVYRQRLDQFIQIGKKLNIGRSRRHTPSDLIGDYEISVHYIDTSLESYARRGATAAAFGGIMPKVWVRDNIIMAEDPDKIDELVDMEEAEVAYPIINMIDRTLDFIRQHTPEANAKARALAKQTISMVRQQMLGNEVSPRQQRESTPIVNMATQRTAGNE